MSQVWSSFWPYFLPTWITSGGTIVPSTLLKIVLKKAKLKIMCFGMKMKDDHRGFAKTMNNWWRLCKMLMVAVLARIWAIYVGLQCYLVLITVWIKYRVIFTYIGTLFNWDEMITCLNNQVTITFNFEVFFMQNLASVYGKAEYNYNLTTM